MGNFIARRADRRSGSLEKTREKMKAIWRDVDAERESETE